ncbi:MAG: acyl-CoA thioesterase [Endomicrobiales bacterium]
MTEIEIRVPYADTDQMGMVYYANYLVYFERGRTEWLREHGLTYRNLEEKGMYFPVVECECRYQAPACYDDLLRVRTGIGGKGPASIEFVYEISRDGKLLATGWTKHPLVNRDFKPVRLPPGIREKFEKSNA